MKLVIRNTIIATVLIIVFPVLSFAQTNQIDAKGRKQGEWIKYFDEPEYAHVVRYKGQFKDDKPVGKFIYYYPTKKIKAIIIHGEKNNRSEAFYYYENEELASHGIYRNQKKDSIWTNFLPFGYYSSEETYKNDVLNGEKITYYGPEVTDGQKIKVVLREDNYSNGNLDGEFIEYFSDGVVKTKGAYKNGAKDGIIMKYNPNGRPMMEERWKENTKHGWWRAFDESGKEIGRKYYKNGVSLEGDVLDKYLKELKEKGISPNK